MKVQLEEAETRILRNCTAGFDVTQSPHVSLAYYEAIMARDDMLSKPGTLAYALNQLMIGVRQSSIREEGAESHAGPQAHWAIEIFYELWITLDLVTQARLNSLFAPNVGGGSNESLEILLLVLFSSIPECVTLTQAQVNKIKATHTVYCTNQMWANLEEIIKFNIDVLAGIPTDPNYPVHHNLPDLSDFDKSLTQILSLQHQKNIAYEPRNVTIKQRQRQYYGFYKAMILGENTHAFLRKNIGDSYDLAYYLSVSLNDEQTISLNVAARKTISNGDQLFYILMRLEKINQRNLFAILENQKLKSLINDAVMLQGILRILAPENKMLLLQSLGKEQLTMLHVNSDQLLYLLTAMSDQKWEALLLLLEEKIFHVIGNENDFIRLTVDLDRNLRVPLVRHVQYYRYEERQTKPLAHNHWSFVKRNIMKSLEENHHRYFTDAADSIDRIKDDPTITPAEVKSILQQNLDEIDSMTSPFTYGDGIINAAARFYRGIRIVAEYERYALQETIYVAPRISWSP